MEPPLAELSAWATLDEAAAWAQVPAPALALSHAGFGGAGGNGLRATGAELEMDFNAFIGTLLDNGQPLARAAQSSLAIAAPLVAIQPMEVVVLRPVST